MKSKLKLTPWFTKGEKPTRIGVYNTSCRNTKQTGDWYSYWDGKIFHQMCGTPERALASGRAFNPSSFMREIQSSWRGLTTQTGK